MKLLILILTTLSISSWASNIDSLKQEALLGNSYAQYKLGTYYEIGKEVEKDLIEAVKWYKKAANLGGDSYAQYRLGFCYENGYGVEKDLIEAVKWFRKSAEQDHSHAQNSLGFCYENGYGVEKDTVEAVKWYRKSANQSDPYGQHNLGRYYYKLAEKLSYESFFISELNFIEAVKWYKKAATNWGLPVAQYDLGYCYYYGIGVEMDFVEAVEWFKKSADQGYEEAKNKLDTIKNFPNEYCVKVCRTRIWVSNDPSKAKRCANAEIISKDMFYQLVISADYYVSLGYGYQVIDGKCYKVKF